MNKLLKLLALITCLLSAQSALAEAPGKLRFGIISTESTQNLRKHWDPFLDDMSRKLGMEVEGFYAPDYAGVIEAMRFGKVDLAWYGNKSAMVAVDRANAEIFVQTVDVSGNPGYWSLLLAHKDSNINSVEDMLAQASRLNFGNGDPNSTSGFLVPSYYVFALNDADPKKIFKRVVNANHETNALAVANRHVDVATNNTENLARIQQNFPDKYRELKVIWKSPLIPSDPIAWRKDLPEETKAKIRAFFLSYGVNGEEVQREREILAALQWAPFRLSDNNQLLPIRQLELFKQRARIEGDDKLSESEKSERLQQIDSQLARLNQKLLALQD